MAADTKRLPIWVSPDLLSRVERLKLIPEEPRWRVLERLLDEHDARETEHPDPPVRLEGAPA